ncbi:MAG: hypothetical protein V1773_09825 [bacterium]
MERIWVLTLLLNICVVAFFIYFVYKILQFVITSTNFYKKIIEREDSIIQILHEIQDNLKK